MTSGIGTSIFSSSAQRRSSAASALASASRHCAISSNRSASASDERADEAIAAAGRMASAGTLARAPRAARRENGSNIGEFLRADAGELAKEGAGLGDIPFELAG